MRRLFISADDQRWKKSGRRTLGAEICGLSFSVFQHQHRVIADRYAGDFALGENPGDVAGALVADDRRRAGGTGDQYSLIRQMRSSKIRMITITRTNPNPPLG